MKPPLLLDENVLSRHDDGAAATADDFNVSLSCTGDWATGRGTPIFPLLISPMPFLSSFVLFFFPFLA